MGKSMAQPFAPYLPLTFTHNSWQYSAVYDGNSNAVCRLDLEDWRVTEDSQDTLEVVQQQYAAFIVKACNAHADLVKALEEIRDHWANQYDHPRKDNEMYRGPYGIGVTDGHRACAIIAREALAKVSQP